MSWRLPRCGAPPGAVPCSPGSSVSAEPRSRGPNAHVSPVAALASLLGGVSPLAAPPSLLLGSLFPSAFPKQPTNRAGGPSLQSPYPELGFSQGFTTGSNATGYTLSSIEALVGAANATQRETIRVELWSAATNGAPNSKVADLTVPATVSAGAVAFTAPANTSLTANTTYHFVLYTDGSFDLEVGSTASDNEDSGGQTGWSIADSSHYLSADEPATTNTWQTNANSLRIRAKGTVKPPAAPTNLVVTPGNGQLELSWTAAAGSNNSYITYYTSAPKMDMGAVADDAAAGSDPATGWKEADSTDQTSGTITGLTNDTAYRVRVSTFSTAGLESQFVFGEGTPKAKEWEFQSSGYTLTPGNSRAVRIELSVPAPAGGLEFTLEQLL